MKRISNYACATIFALVIAGIGQAHAQTQCCAKGAPGTRVTCRAPGCFAVVFIPFCTFPTPCGDTFESQEVGCCTQLVSTMFDTGLECCIAAPQKQASAAVCGRRLVYLRVPSRGYVLVSLPVQAGPS